MNAEADDKSLIVIPATPLRPWPAPASFDSADQSDLFRHGPTDAPNVVILGTGARQRFVHPLLVSS